MGRIVEDLVVASTSVDRHGEQLSREELEELFNQIPGERLLNVDHDPRQPPVARVFNTRLEELPDGTTAIKSDAEVLDEDRFAHVRGLSIAYHRVPSGPEAEPDVVVSLNPRQIDADEVRKEMSSLTPFPGTVEVVERSEKALDAATAAFIVWVLISKGFWDEAGADLYRLCKRLIKEALAGEPDADVAIAIAPQAGSPEVILSGSRELDPESADPVDIDALVREAQALAPGAEIVKVVARLRGDGSAQLDFVVSAAGATFRPPEEQ